MIASDFYPMADALQLNLSYTDKSIVTEGNDARRYHVGAFEMKYKPKTIASGLEKERAWLLLRVKGSLHVLMVQQHEGKKLEIFIVDGGRVSLVKEAAEKLNGQPVMAVISTLFDGLVATYTLKYQSETWKKGVIDDFALDSGQTGDVTKDGGTAAEQGGSA